MFVIGAIVPYELSESPVTNGKGGSDVEAGDVHVGIALSKSSAVTAVDSDDSSEAASPACLKCPKGLTMQQTTNAAGEYSRGWTCDHCNVAYPPHTERWSNGEGYDCCYKCLNRKSRRNLITLS